MVYRFGVFELVAETGELRRNGVRLSLEPQPARALAALLARAGEVVSRDELKAAVWGRDTHVDFDRGLAYVVSQIRSALGDSGENPRFVRTLPRRGYTFIAPVQTIPPSPRPHATGGGTAEALPVSAMPARRAGVRWSWMLAALVVAAAVSWGVWRQLSATATPVTIAVSVFDNETGLSEHDRLVAGLSDLVVTHLTAMAPKRVAVIGNARILRQPRNIRNLQAVRDALDADYVLLGQLQRADSDSGLRFITHFIRMSDEAHLRANRLSFPDGDLSRLESEVVAEFGHAVRAHVLGERSK